MPWLGFLSAILVFPDLTQCVCGGGGFEGCLLVVVVVVFPGQKSIFFDRSNLGGKIDNANFVV